MRSTDGRSPLVGRAVQLDVITALLESAAAGSGQVLLVQGEAGIGKSRLVEEAAALAEGRRMRVVMGRCSEGSAGFRSVSEALLDLLATGPMPDTAALRPYRHALSAIAPGGAVSHEPPAESLVDPVLMLGEGLLQLLATVAPQGSLLVFEDLHWADADTVALVEYLVAATRSRPVLVAGTVRDDERISARLERLGVRRDLTRLRLSGLTESEVAELAVQLSGGRTGLRVSQAQLTLLVQESRGLPLVVEELTSSWGAADDAGRASTSRSAGMPSSWATRQPAGHPEAGAFCRTSLNPLPGRLYHVQMSGARR